MSTETIDGRIVARALFLSSVTRKDLWHYGYLVTSPEYRRRGLARSLLLKGLFLAVEAGARVSACYVSGANVASQELNAGLGYVRLPFVRLHLTPSGSPVRDDVRPIAIAAHRIDEQALKTIEVLEEFGPAEGRQVLVDELNVQRPFLPWRAPDAHLVRIEWKNSIVALVRTGHESANVLLMPEAYGENLASILRAIGDLCRRDTGAKKLLAFLPDRVVKRVALDYPCDQVFWHPKLAKIPLA